MPAPARISFVIMAVSLVLIGWLHLATLVLTGLFGHFALRAIMNVCRHKALTVVVYAICVATIGYGAVTLTRKAYKALPDIANNAIPKMVEFAEKQGVELPFTDYASLKTRAMDEVQERLANVSRYAREALVQIAMLIIGLVVAASLFINSRWQVEGDPHAVQGSLYVAVVAELAIRFHTFYRSFATVIGAQLLISAVNTTLTTVFLFWNQFPFALVIAGLTFLCGLLPIIGNLLSNTLIVGVAFTISPKMALVSLAFLVVIHKLEYFLNSKIIGDRIKNPMWLTLIGLVVGEKLMGVPGMILAPVVLHYIKVEASRRRAVETAPAPEATA